MKKPTAFTRLAAPLFLAAVFLTASSVWSQNLYVGSNSSGNTTNFTSGTNSYINTYIGFNAGANSNTLNVLNTNTLLTNSADLFVGYAGSGNSLTISNGGIVRNSSGTIGSDTNSLNNSVLVTGSNSLWSNSSTLTIGLSGSGNSLTISNGGIVRNSSGTIGSATISLNNSVIVTDTNSLWSNSSTLTVGLSGGGNSLVISNGGKTVNNGNFFVGYNSTSSSNSIIITGTNSLWNSTGTLFLGVFGSVSNSLIISNGAQLNDNYTQLGYANSSGNSVIVTGSNSCLNNSNNVIIGLYNNSSNNSLVISNGGQVNNAYAVIGYTNSSGNSVIVTGANSHWSNSNDVFIGYLNGSSNNSLVISNAGVVQSASTIIGSASSSSNNTLLITGTNSVLNTTNLVVGSAGGGTLSLANGGAVTGATNILVASNAGSVGTINIGTFGGTDSAGTVSTPLVTFGAGTGTINFNQTNSATFTNQFQGGSNVTINQLGSGTTILTASNSYGGQTIISNGTLIASNASALGNSAVVLGDGSNFSTLRLGTTNLTVSSLVWGTNGIISQQPGYQTLTVTGALINSNGGIFNFAGSSLSNDTNTLVLCTNISGTTNYSVANIEGYSIVTNGTGIYGYIAATSNLVVSTNITQTSALTVSSITFDNGSQVTFGQSGSILASNNVTFNSNSAIVISLGSNPSQAAIQAGGTNTFNGPTTLNVLTTSSAASMYGRSNTILTAASIVGKSNLKVVSDNPLLRFREIWVGDPELVLLGAPASYTQMAANQNQVNVARALDSFIPAPSGTDQYTISLALDELTAAQYPNAFQQISPALYSSLSTIAFNTANAQNNELVQRLGNIRVAGVGFDSAGLGDPTMVDDNKNPKPNATTGKDILIPSVDNHWGIFTDANGIFANVNINNQLPGYSSESGGITLGADYKWNETFSTGIYTGYQGTQSKQSGGNFICDNSCRFGLFGTYQRGGLFANAIIGGDSHSYQIDRTIQFPGINRTATSAPTAGELDSMLATGYDIKRGNFTFGPTTSLQYTYLGVQPFTEAGAQSLNLNVSNENANSMIYSLGSHCFYTWQLNKEVLLVPQINLAWQHEFLQNPYAINSTLQGGGGNFTYMTTTPNRDSLYTGIGFTVNLAKKYDASFFYNASAGNSDLVSQNFFASLGTRF